MAVRKIILDMRTSNGLGHSISQLKTHFKNIGPKDIDLREYARYLELQYLRPMMVDLRKTPPKRKFPQDYPIEFVSDLQRRYVMWMLDGKPHRRTNTIVNAWGYKVTVKTNTISIHIRNDEEAAKFVMGEVGLGVSKRSIKRYTKSIQPMHKHRWQPAYKTVQKHWKPAQEDAMAKLKEWVGMG